MALFWVKIDHDGRLPYQTSNPSGNCKMGQNTPQAMGKDVLDTFMPHPGVIPGPGGSEIELWRRQKKKAGKKAPAGAF